jgi:hypothetical protein
MISLSFFRVTHAFGVMQVFWSYAQNFSIRVGSVHSGLPKWTALFASQKTR